MMRRLFALGIVCFGLAACGGGGGSASTNALPLTLAMTVDSRHNNELPEPPEIRPVNGVATLALVAQINPATGLPALVYQGQISGLVPTIRIKPGDSFVIDVADNLPSQPHSFGGNHGDINLHFHGLGVSPNPPGDDVLRTLGMPGGSLHYVVNVPTNQEPGLYWFHPHVHGLTNFQVGESGMSGAIVVTGLERHLPGLAKMKERLIVVRDTGIGVTAQPRSLPHLRTNIPCSHPDPGLTLTLNGAIKPNIRIAPGESQFFRLVNATGHKTLNLAIDGGKLDVVAIDGFALDAYPGTGPTASVSKLVIPPAARAEFIVTGPPGGNAKLRTLCYDSGPGGDPDPEQVMAVLHEPRTGLDRPLIAPAETTRLTVGAPLPNNAFSFPLPPIAAKRTVVLSEDDFGMYINGKRFNMMDPPMFVVRVGTVEQWKIENVTHEVHDFHIHQIHFFVKEIDGTTVAHPHWADSVVVPHVKPGKIPGTLTLLMDFRDPVIRGEFMFHCHILDHEDSGMMAKIGAI